MLHYVQHDERLLTPSIPAPVPETTPTPAAPPSLTDFASFYLYGLTTNPYQQSTDLAKFGQLYNLVIGEHGGV
ncbi:MAG: hypothetical protein ACRYFZ_24220, partial [Janthinobacterium lividum]